MRFALAMCVVLVGCAQVLELDAFGKETRGTLASCGQLPFNSSSCGACMEDSCCAQATACAFDEVCKTVQSCFAACEPGDQNCIHVCGSTVVYSSNALRGLEQCLATQCAAPCEIGCARTQSPSRASCLEALPGCCENEQAIWNNPAASAWLACQSTCMLEPNDLWSVPDACGCVTANPGSQPLADTAGMCSKTCLTVAPEWSCLGKVAWPSNNDGAGITYKALLTDLQTVAPLSEFTMAACDGLAPGCAGVAGTNKVTAQNGVATFRLDRHVLNSADYFGYLLAQAKGYPDTLLFQLPSARQSGSNNFAIISPATMTALRSLVGVTSDPTLGDLGIVLWDCNRNPAPNVRIKTDPPGDIVYVGNGVPDRKLSATTSGQAIVFNLKPGRVHVVMTRADVLDAQGQEQVVASYDFLIEPSSVTIATLPPTPL